METEGPAPSDGEVGEHPDRLPSENRIGRRTDMEKTKNVRKRGLTPFPPFHGQSVQQGHRLHFIRGHRLHMNCSFLLVLSSAFGVDGR